MERAIVLAGTKCALAAMTEADQPMFFEWMKNPELRELIDDPRQPTMEGQRAWFVRVQQPDRKFFSIVTLPNHTLIGNCGFVNLDASKKVATLRITIGNSDYLGQGFGSEAVVLLVRYGFETMGLQRILLNVLESNTRAVRSYEKAGFSVISKDLQNGKQMLTMSISNPVHS